MKNRLIILLIILSGCGTNGQDPNFKRASKEIIEIRYTSDIKDTIIVYPFDNNPQSLFIITRGKDRPISCLTNSMTLIACDVKSFKVLSYIK